MSYLPKAMVKGPSVKIEAKEKSCIVVNYSTKSEGPTILIFRREFANT